MKQKPEHPLTIRQSSKRSFSLEKIDGEWPRVFLDSDYEPIKNWMDDNKLTYKEQAHILSSRTIDGSKRLLWVKLVFYSDASAVLFKLRWE